MQDSKKVYKPPKNNPSHPSNQKKKVEENYRVYAYVQDHAHFHDVSLSLKKGPSLKTLFRLRKN